MNTAAAVDVIERALNMANVKGEVFSLQDAAVISMAIETIKKLVPKTEVQGDATPLEVVEKAPTKSKAKAKK